MSTTIETNEVEEMSEPYMEAVIKISEEIAVLIQEKVTKEALFNNENTLAFSGICQMLTMNAIVDLAEETECDPLDIVDSWANSFYEALGEGTDDDEEE